MDAIERGLVDLVINVPIEFDELGRPDGYHIRRRAVDAGIPLVTDLQRAQAIIEALRHRKAEALPILSWDEYAARRSMALKYSEGEKAGSGRLSLRSPNQLDGPRFE